MISRRSPDRSRPVDVPQYDQKGVTQGWPQYYWKPWKKYLAAKSKTR